MAIIFFDSSALVRRYDATEPGAATVRTLCRRSLARVLMIFELASVEVASALARKLREGSISPTNVRRLWRQFRYHAAYQYRVNELDEDTTLRAEQLVFRQPLRAADALQIASALEAKGPLTGLDSNFRFCTADERQRRAAEAEGL